MTDTVDDFSFYSEQLLKKSKTNPLRERMKEFIEKNREEADLKKYRKEASNGKNLSDIVTENREERV